MQYRQRIDEIRRRGKAVGLSRHSGILRGTSMDGLQPDRGIKNRRGYHLAGCGNGALVGDVPPHRLPVHGSGLSRWSLRIVNIGVQAIRCPGPRTADQLTFRSGV